MGRRSIKSTKSGKFMNPTDQARKEARKKELKKNKKQRQLVRTTVLKNKDPGAIIHELDKLDEMEYNPLVPPTLADKVLKDKRKKLKETLDRVMKLYQKDEPTYWNELRSIEMDYERRRFHRIQYFEAVKQAEQVSSGIGTNIEDIPLPPSLEDGESGPSAGAGGFPSIPLPPPGMLMGNFPPPPFMFSVPPPPPLPQLKSGILKPSPSSSSVIDSAPQVYCNYSGTKEPPGPPPGYPPEDFMDSSSSDESDSDSDGEEQKNKKSTASTSVKKSVRFEGPSAPVDEMEAFMKEVEEDLKQIKEEDLKPPGMEGTGSSTPEESTTSETPIPAAQSQTLPVRPYFPPLPPLMQQRLRYPPPPFGVGVGSVTGHMPPPPPPPRIRGFSNPRFSGSGGGRLSQSNNPPKLLFNSGTGQGKISSEAMISAKPQIRSLSADVTRFIPVAVKTRKDDGTSGQPGMMIPPSKSSAHHDFAKPSSLRNFPHQRPGPSKDDAYADFMKEMEGML